jgi:translation elongation factor EF-Tu-like GTPase
MEAGTALAIVSLGIVVCEGIVKYSSAYKHRKEDVSSLIEISTDLQYLLQEVQIWLGNQPAVRGSIVERLEGCVKTCLAHIDEVLAMCSKYSPPGTKDLKSRLVYAKRGLQFPFKKETIKA